MVKKTSIKRYAETDPTKLRGGYYTPELIATFLTKWAIANNDGPVLEPSCGDGQFIEAVKSVGRGKVRVVGVELFEGEAQKARARGGKNSKITTGDFFSWYAKNKPDGKFQAVLGNPPFIRFQSFPEEHRDLAFTLMQEEGLSPSRLTNAWVPFVVLATRALKVGGRLAMVLPAELLQVGYAGELRSYLARKYEDLEIVTFRRLVFPDIQQETVLLLGKRRDVSRSKIAFHEFTDSSDMASGQLAVKSAAQPLNHEEEKWTQYYLSRDELSLIRKIASAKDFKRIRDFAVVNVGIVTGNNDFFVLNEKAAKDSDVLRYCVPIVARSNQLKGVQLSEEDFSFTKSDGGRCFLLHTGKIDRNKLPKSLLAYVKSGESSGVHDGFKCRIRLPSWWEMPAVWSPDVFLLRQINDGPRMVSNGIRATCTDTIHRLKLKENISPELFAATSMNSLTFAFAEIYGRSYGGGVLELEPSEAMALPFPNPEKGLDIRAIDAFVRNRDTVAALDEVDRTTLIAQGLSQKEIKMLRQIWQRMYSRRRGRKMTR